MPRRSRLDSELVRRGLARSRGEAADLISAGRVRVAGRPAAKPASAVAPEEAVVVAAEAAPAYASRGGHKLAGALDRLGVPVAGRRCLDAGASTGGFTDVLLRRGAREVVAVDVGYGQLSWALRSDDRVRVLDRTNVRDMRETDIGGRVELVVADLSFISLTVALPALLDVTVTGADALPMVKPQFEVGRGNVGPGGVVRDPALHREAVQRVAAAAAELGWGVDGLVASPLPGPAGNVEFFLWLRRDAAALDPSLVAEVTGG